jgi:hypothetical protein
VQALDKANSAKCPTSNIIQLADPGETGKKYLIDKNGFTLDGKMPPSDWKTYNCKVLIASGDTLTATAGYVYIIPEQFGFDRWVKVIVQPRAAYLDFNYRDQTSNPNEMVKLFISKRTRRFILPDDYDVLIDFEPATGDSAFNKAQQDATTKGTFKVSAMHITADKATALTTGADSGTKPFATTGANDAEKSVTLGELI